MPKTDLLEASSSWLNVLKALGPALYRTVEQFADRPEGPQDFDAASAVIANLLGRFRNVLPDLAAAVPPTGITPFLVDDGKDHGPDQATVTGFSAMIVSHLVAAGTIPPALVDVTTRILAKAWKMLGGNAMNIEMWIRYRANLKNQVTVLFASDAVAQTMIQMGVPHGQVQADPDVAPTLGEFPISDEVKEQDLQGVPPASFLGLLSKISGIPGGTEKSDRRIGQAAHTYIQDAYCAAFPNHYVVVDGRVRATSLPGGVLRLSRMTSPDPVTASKIAAFKAAMLNTGTNRPLRPDIADLHDAAVGRNPADSWGWYEIKPWNSLEKAVGEIYGFYLPRWNLQPTVVARQPTWDGEPGQWFPPMLGIVTTLTPARVIFSATMPPGCIGYLTIPLRNPEPLLEVVRALLPWALWFMSGIGKSLDDLERSPAHEVFRYLAILLFFALIVWLLFYAGAIAVVVGAAAALLAVVATKMSAVLDELKA